MSGIAIGRRRVVFTVTGIAQPKGSTKAFVPKSWAAAAMAQGRAPRAIVTADNTKSKGWQQLVAEQAQTVAGELFEGPVALAVTFWLPRPQSLPKRVTHHTKKPDLDKLARALKDALKGVLYRDDAQVVDLNARKRYAEHGCAPCAFVTVEDAAPPDVKPGELFAGRNDADV